MITAVYNLNQLAPAMRADLAVTHVARLPVGSNLKKGQVLGNVNVVARNEVKTLTISGSPTGWNATFTWNGKTTSATANLVTAIPTAAQVTTALEELFGKGGVLVTVASNVYTITFQNHLSQVMIGGTLAITAAFTAGSTPSAAIANTTKGSAGAGQVDAYDAGASNGTEVAKSVLAYDQIVDGTGQDLIDTGPSGRSATAQIYLAGYFKVSDLIGLDADAVAELGRLVVGTTVSSVGAILKIN